VDFYDNSLPVATIHVDAAFFAAACQTDVIVRDAQGNPVTNADGSFQTTKGELRDLLVPMAGDRARLLAQAANNQRVFVQQANEWVGNLNAAMEELTRHMPVGADKNGPKNNIEGFDLDDFTLSARTSNTLAALKDGDGNSFLANYFGVSPPAGGYTTTGASITKMADKQAWSEFDNAMKSAVDQASQKASLDQTTLQGLVSRQNNAIETMSDLQQKFASTFDKLVGNLRPAQ